MQHVRESIVDWIGDREWQYNKDSNPSYRHINLSDNITDLLKWYAYIRPHFIHKEPKYYDYILQELKNNDWDFKHDLESQIKA